MYVNILLFSMVLFKIYFKVNLNLKDERLSTCFDVFVDIRFITALLN